MIYLFFARDYNPQLWSVFVKTKCGKWTGLTFCRTSLVLTCETAYGYQFKAERVYISVMVAWHDLCLLIAEQNSGLYSWISPSSTYKESQKFNSSSPLNLVFKSSRLCFHHQGLRRRRTRGCIKICGLYLFCSLRETTPLSNSSFYPKHLYR